MLPKLEFIMESTTKADGINTYLDGNMELSIIGVQKSKGGNILSSQLDILNNLCRILSPVIVHIFNASEG